MDCVGLDIGFGFTKATNGREFVVFKSLLGEAADIQFRMNIGRGEPARNLHVTVDGQSYFVGEYAEQQSNVRQFTLDQEQLTADMSKVLTLTALGHLLDTYAPVHLVTGLPVGYYRDYQPRLKKLLAGTHDVTFEQSDGAAQTRQFNIGQIRVIPQPLGSVFNLLMNDAGRIGNRDLARDKIGVVDIGFRTTDFCIFDRLQYVERGSATTDTGISRCFSLIAKKLREESGVNLELFRLYKAVETGFIKIRGKEYNLTRMRDAVFASTAQIIAGDAERLWADDWDMDAILITGGGAMELAALLTPLISGQVIPVDAGIDARLNNVQGYQKYARYLWDRTAEPSSPPAE